MTWHINPDADMRERVQELAKREMRPMTNMAMVLISEALLARQIAESKNHLVSMIRGEQP
jgi:CopG antitoxin of type II toxin-antitoxin system